MKIRVSKKAPTIEEDYGILYLVHFHLEGKDLIKIGITTRKIEDRVSEILVSIFKKYREFPYCYPKRFQKTADVFEKEAILHKHFEEYRYVTEKVFSGSTEFFDIPIDRAVEVYERLLAGESLAGK